MKSLTNTHLAESKVKLGTEPIVIVRIEWEHLATTYYSTRTATMGGGSCREAILSVSPLTYQERADNLGVIGSIQVIMDDTDGHFKARYGNEVFYDIVCTVYHSYAAFDHDTDAEEVFKGKIMGNVLWSEGERTLNITIEDNLPVDIVGYKLEEDTDFSHPVVEKSIGKVLPMCFGEVVKVPAVKLHGGAKGSLENDISFEDNFDIDVEPSNADTNNHFTVKNGEKFPQYEAITISIKGVLFRGKMVNDVFYCGKDNYTITTKTKDNINKAYLENIAFSARSGADPDHTNLRVAWLTAGNIAGKYCYIKKGSNYFINKCIKQVDTKCWFLWSWEDPKDRLTPLYVDSTYILVEACGDVSLRWTEADFYWVEDINVAKDQAIAIFPVLFLRTAVYIWSKKYRKDDWWLDAGTDVFEIPDYSDVYIPNTLPTTSITKVYGHYIKKTDSDEGNQLTKKLFLPIPKSYYSIKLSKDYGKGNWTGLEFDVPLAARVGEGWVGDVFVSLTSSEGQNSVDIIKWFIDTYTDYSMSDADYNSEQPKLEPYPANFVLTKRESAIKLISQIAWQSRCALWVRNDLVYLKYLAARPETHYTINAENTELKSMLFAFTPISEVKTSLTGKWIEDYSGEDDTNHSIEYINNTDKYGVLPIDINFWIYSNESCVKRSLYFWGYRLSNVWRIVTASHFLPLLRNDVYDYSNYSIQDFSPHDIRGIITGIKHDLIENRIGIDSILASKSGDVYVATTNPVEDNDFWTGDSNFPCDYVNDQAPKSLLYGLSEYTGIATTAITFLGGWIRGIYDVLLFNGDSHDQAELERKLTKRLT